MLYCIVAREWTDVSEKRRNSSREEERFAHESEWKIRAALTSTIRETRYFALNFTNSNVIQTCHDRDWVKLNKKLDTRSNFTKFHTVHDRNEWKLHEKENQYLFDRAKYRGRKFAQETTLTKIHIKIIIIYRKL